MGRHARGTEPQPHPAWPDELAPASNVRAARRQAVRDVAKLTVGSRQFGRGPGGPQAGVVWLREKRPALEETTDQLLGTYPFVAGSALPYFGQYHGINRLSGAAFGWDGPVAYARRLISNPCIVIYGLIGSGKSMGAKSMLWRGLPFGRKFAVPGDIRGEYVRLCRAAGGSPIVLGPGSPTRLSPLASPPRPPHVPESFWRETVATHRQTTLTTLAKAALQRPLSQSELTALDLALADATRTDSDVDRWRQPALGDISRWLLDPPASQLVDEHIPDVDRFRSAIYDLSLAMRLLVRGVFAGVLDVETTATIDASGPCVVVDMSRLQLDDAALALVVTCTQAAVELGVQFDQATWTVCYDEVWRYMRFYGLVARLANRIKVVRDRVGGIPLLIAHRPSDWTTGDAALDTISQGMLKDIDVHVLHRQSQLEAEAAGRMLALPSTVVDTLTGLDQGSALWRIADRQGVSHHVIVDHFVDRSGPEWPIMHSDQGLVGEYRSVPDPASQMSSLLDRHRSITGGDEAA
jgi:hypothetical protein